MYKAHLDGFTALPESTLAALIKQGYGLRSLDNDYVHNISSDGRGLVFITSDFGLYLEVTPKDFFFKDNVLRVTNQHRRTEYHDFEIVKTITITINNIGDELV